MRSFNPLLFRLYASDLEQAILGLSRERMGLREVKDRLSHIPGIESLTVEQRNGTEIYSLGDQRFEIPKGNASVRSRVQSLANAFQPVAQPEFQPLGLIMSDEPTPLPTVEIVPQAIQTVVVSEPIKRSVTGASHLGSSIASLIAAIKGEVDAAHTDLQSAAADVRDGINTVKSVAKHLRTEADDIRSSLGQFSNGGPE